jgi:predicted metallo-beta-lactamase superfamily hydrolase
VRGLSCLIEVEGRKVLIDPGIALGFTRWCLHPHPIQAVAGDVIRKEILDAWSEADYVVLSHMHGDHVPLYNANPFQLDLRSLPIREGLKIIVPPSNGLSHTQTERLRKIRSLKDVEVHEVMGEEYSEGPITVFRPYAHGLSSSSTVMITLIIDSDKKVVHASDTQLLNPRAAHLIHRLKPDLVITDGPPVYRYLSRPETMDELLRTAEKNLKIISSQASKVVIDHHLLRHDMGYRWLAEMKRVLKDTLVLSAAEYEGRKPLLLEAWRRTLYSHYPVDNNWFTRVYREEVEKHLSIYERIKKASSQLEEVSEKDFNKLLYKLEKI